jgi:hypothetical protein
LKRSQGLNSTEWGEKSLVYHSRRGRMATYFCRTDVDSIGFVHIFGSNATGPYLSGFGNNPDYIYEDTKAYII